MMKQKHISWPLTSALILPLILAACSAEPDIKTPVHQPKQVESTAKIEPAPKVERKLTQRDIDLASAYSETQVQSHTMMGHVSISSLAIELGMKDVALHHIGEAIKLGQTLKDNVPTVSTHQNFKYGKVSYEVDNVAKDYLVPLIDDVMLIENYEETLKKGKEAKLAETDAEVVTLKINLDINKAVSLLEAAKSDVTQDNFVAAAIDLAEISDAMVTAETVATDPVWAVRDNLSLAMALAKEGHFKAARFAVKKAKKGMIAIEKNDKYLKHAESTKQLLAGFDELDNTLKHADPDHARKEAAAAEMAKHMATLQIYP